MNSKGKTDNNKTRPSAAFFFALISAALLAALIALSAQFRLFAADDMKLSAESSFIDQENALTVTLSGTGTADETGLIAEAFLDGSAVERRYKTITGAGKVTFEPFQRKDLFDFRVMAVNKDTLAPVCDPLELHRELSDEEVRITENNVNIPVSKEGLSQALKAVTKDLILAERAFDKVAALDTEVITVEYVEEVLSTEKVDGGIDVEGQEIKTLNKLEQAADGDDAIEVQTLVSQNRLEQMSRYEAVSCSQEKYDEALARVAEMKAAYEKLKTSASVLYGLAGEAEGQNDEVRYFALQAGDISAAVLDSASGLETDLSVKREDRNMDDTGFLDIIESTREDTDIIRLCGGAGVLMEGGFGVYPKGAELALVADKDTSAVILYPDNGKVTEGRVARTSKENEEKTDCSVGVDKVIIAAGNNAGEIGTVDESTSPSFTHYDGFDPSGGVLVSKASEVAYKENVSFSKTAVRAVTDYAMVHFNIGGSGIHETWDQMTDAFIASADDSEEKLKELAGGDLEKTVEEFSGKSAREFNARRGYTEYWEGSDSPAGFNGLDFGRHYTKDKDGNIVGTYEICSYGVKYYELYYTSPVPDENQNGFPDSRRGCKYEKLWTKDEDGKPYVEEFEYSTVTGLPGGGSAGSASGSVSPAGVFSAGAASVEGVSFADGVSSTGGVSSAGDGQDPDGGYVPGRTGFVDEDNGTYPYGRPGEPEVLSCHYKGHGYYGRGRSIESYAVYNPKRWEAIAEKYAEAEEGIETIWDRKYIYCYDVLWQKEFNRDGVLDLECRNIGAVSGNLDGDWVYVKGYDTSTDQNMLEFEWIKYESTLVNKLYIYQYLDNFFHRYSEVVKAYYTPDYFTKSGRYYDGTRASRVPEDKRRLLYGKLLHYSPAFSDLKGYNLLISWPDGASMEPGEGDRPEWFAGADEDVFPQDEAHFMESGHNNVGLWHWVIRGDGETVTSNYKLLFKTKGDGE